MICLSVSNDFDGKELLSNKLFDRNVCGCRVAEIPCSCLEHFESALRICEKKKPTPLHINIAFIQPICFRATDHMALEHRHSL
jgi:hypothetical protein